MNCKTRKVSHPMITMIDEICDKIGVDEFCRREKELWGYLTYSETVLLLHRELVQSSPTTMRNKSEE